ncbi:MAG: hypothetical protein M3Y21_12425, partial [Candidatus Eremiobacteraeota bacterium]|nr:hypothetical protein [Candidatus Eremiobacteraeota bacterium]
MKLKRLEYSLLHFLEFVKERYDMRRPSRVKCFVVSAILLTSACSGHSQSNLLPQTALKGNQSRTVSHRAALASGGGIGQDGVQEIYPTASGGTTWSLDTSLDDPRSDPKFAYDNMVKDAPTTRQTEGGVTYYEVTAGDVNYKSGGSGKTIRIDVYPGGGNHQQQKYSWRDNPDYLYNDKGIRSGERTIYVRLRGSLSSDIHHAIASKINGAPAIQTHDNGRSVLETTFPTVSNNDQVKANWNYDHFPYVAVPNVNQLSQVGEIPSDQWVG